MPKRARRVSNRPNRWVAGLDSQHFLFLYLSSLKSRDSSRTASVRADLTRRINGSFDIHADRRVRSNPHRARSGTPLFIHHHAMCTSTTTRDDVHYTTRDVHAQHSTRECDNFQAALKAFLIAHNISCVHLVLRCVLVST